MRAGYVQTARELGGAPMAVAVGRRRADRASGCPARCRSASTGRRRRPTRWARSSGITAAAGSMGDLDGFDHVARELCEVSRSGRRQRRLPAGAGAPVPGRRRRRAGRAALGRRRGRPELGIDLGRVAVGGDSAGGQLAAQAALREPGLAAAQLLVYPALDPLMATSSYREFAAGPGLTAAEMAYFWAAYAGGAPVDALALPGPGGRPAGLDRGRGPRPAARRRDRSTPRRCATPGCETHAGRLRGHDPRRSCAGAAWSTAPTS